MLRGRLGHRRLLGDRVGLSEDDRPREEKCYLDVEDHEQQSDDVEAQVELNPGTADGRLAALVDGQLLGAGPCRPDQFADQQMHEDEGDRDHQK